MNRARHRSRAIRADRMAPTSAHGDGLDFVGPYASTQQGILVRAEDAGRYTSLDSLAGKHVCVWRGTTSKTELEPLVPTRTRNEARPTDADIDRYSCRDEPGNASVND
ncbi:hypothetical protein AB0L85_14175 [Streptomyces sp. NPDC052051]|uniref:hypothetical protein n=1 Tax=Streptomyces sp. NPDC052051 TaxID=3154649 RepID=UPI003435FBA0